MSLETGSPALLAEPSEAETFWHSLIRAFGDTAMTDAMSICMTRSGHNIKEQVAGVSAQTNDELGSQISGVSSANVVFKRRQP